MANLTIAVDDELLRAAKACAAAEDVLKLAEETNSGSGGRRWTREEVYER